jgi:3-oxoacyl-[acyl-carrier-protein] synthase-3
MGTTRRRQADVDMPSRQAEALAAQAALADAGIAGEDVDMVVSWSVIPDRITPPSAPWVAHTIGARRAFGVNLDGACTTTLCQMTYAAAMIETGRIKYAVLTQSHLITRAFGLMHPASPNIGDAATAIVMGPGSRHEFIDAHAVSEGEYHDAVVWTRGHEDDHPWHLSGKPFYLGSKNPAGARRLIQNGVRLGVETVGELMDKLELPTSMISALISVQPRRWFPGAIAETLGLSGDIAPQTFDELAHLGPSGTVTNLIAARERGLLHDGALVAFYAQGAGFTRAAALVRW